MSKDVKYFTANVDENLHIVVKNSEDSIGIQRILSSFQNSDVIITIEKAQYKRSNSQNRYYWGVVLRAIKLFIEDTQGEKITSEQLHTFHLTKFKNYKLKSNKVKVLGRNGRIQKLEFTGLVSKTTKKMTVAEFSEFLQQVIEFWSDKGAKIPPAINHCTLSDYHNY